MWCQFNTPKGFTPQTYGYRGCRMKAALTTFKIGFSTETTTQPDNRKSLGSAFEPGSHYELRSLYTVPSLLPVTNLNVFCLRLFKFSNFGIHLFDNRFLKYIIDNVMKHTRDKVSFTSLKIMHQTDCLYGKSPLATPNPLHFWFFL